jgi:hypothetical protein|tara:strand:- start:135 stop:440 length:306 start_codon:yes stop_codon:yes gene_type:complete
MIKQYLTKVNERVEAYPEYADKRSDFFCSINVEDLYNGVASRAFFSRNSDKDSFQLYGCTLYDHLDHTLPTYGMGTTPSKALAVAIENLCGNDADFQGGVE